MKFYLKKGGQIFTKKRKIIKKTLCLKEEKWLLPQKGSYLIMFKLVPQKMDSHKRRFQKMPPHEIVFKNSQK